MIRRFARFALAALLVACGGSSGSTESDTTASQGSGDEAAATPVEPAEPAEPSEPAEPVEPEQPSFEGTITSASIPLLEALADGRVGWDRVTAPREEGLIFVENYQGDDGELVQRARHHCNRALENQYEALKTRLTADLARGRELGDMGCNGLDDPPRMDCSIGGSEEQPVTHYIFTEGESGVRLQAIYVISEVGQTERYVARAHTYANRQAAMARRGCNR